MKKLILSAIFSTLFMLISCSSEDSTPEPTPTPAGS